MVVSAKGNSMAHKILGSRFLSRSQPAWHGLGEIFPADSNLTPSQAIAKVAGDITTDKRRVAWRDDDGEWQEIPDYRAIVRPPVEGSSEYEVFGVTGTKFEPISLADVGEVLDGMPRDVHKVETAGCLEKGANTFLSLRGEDWELLGKGEEAHQSYILVSVSLKPGKALITVKSTEVRVVCWNTQSFALAGAGLEFKLDHNKAAKDRLGLATKIMATVTQAREESRKAFEAFATTPATSEDVRTVVNSAFVVPAKSKFLQEIEKAFGDGAGSVVQMDKLDAVEQNMVAKDQERWERSAELVHERRNATLEQFDSFSDTSPDLGGTVWAAYNAVTEVADWRDGRNAAPGSLWGSRAAEKERAFTAALELVS